MSATTVDVLSWFGLTGRRYDSHHHFRGTKHDPDRVTLLDLLTAAKERAEQSAHSREPLPFGAFSITLRNASLDLYGYRDAEREAFALEQLCASLPHEFLGNFSPCSRCSLEAFADYHRTTWHDIAAVFARTLERFHAPP